MTSTSTIRTALPPLWQDLIDKPKNTITPQPPASPRRETQHGAPVARDARARVVVFGWTIRCVAVGLVIWGVVIGASPASAQTNEIGTVAGSGTAGFNGDGISAPTAQLNLPVDVEVMADGGYLITDQVNRRIRRVARDGTITTVAGSGTSGFAGDGGPAVDAQLSVPNQVAVTADRGFLIADSNNHRIRRVSPSGTITTIAGTARRASPATPAPRGAHS